MFSTRQANVLRVLRLIGSPTRAYTTRKAALRCTQVLCQCNLNERTSPFLSRQDQRAGNFSVWCSTRQSRGLDLKAAVAKTLSSRATDRESRNCSHEELIEHLKNGDAVVIDVRQREEIEQTGKMERALNIPLGELKVALAQPSNKFEKLYGCPLPEEDEADIIFLCLIGKRSQMAIEIAAELGFTKARHYPGGWRRWTELQETK